MKWKVTPLVRTIYEAFGALGDGRLEMGADTDDGIKTAKLYSSSGNKYYDISYDPKSGAIMSNDNASYWKGYLGYPGIAYLMEIGSITYDDAYAEALKDIAWKDVNTKIKSDPKKIIDYVQDLMKERGVSVGGLKNEVRVILDQLIELNPSKLGARQRPPSGY